MTWISLTIYWPREKLNDSIQGTCAQEGYLSLEFSAAIKVSLLLKYPILKLTAEAIHIHIFYFPTINFFRDKMKTKIGLTRQWLNVDSRLQVDLGLHLAHVTLT